jgi:LPXTG-motif cell wall-anchored protein
MRTLWSTFRHGLAAAALVAVAALGTATSAHAGGPPQVLGQVACDPASGEQLITWTYENGAGETLDFDSGVATPSLTAGSLVSTVVGMEPATGLTFPGSAVGETVATADAVGSVSVSLVFARTVNQGTITVTGTVLLFGDCVVDTTAPVVETTAPDTAAPDTAATTTGLVGSGGGRLPHSGNDGTLAIVAALLIAAGAGLLLLRRRAVTN